MKKVTRIIALILAASAIMLCGCDKKNENDKSTETGGTEEVSVKYAETEEVTNYVKIEMKDGGIIIVELFPDQAPITVANFQKLVGEKFYDGIIFHRVLPDLIIQGGDPAGTGYGGSDETIKGEFAQNGVNNNLKHVRGTISMARTNAPDSASSQFFICCRTYSSWDGLYAAFGNVISGMDVVDAISNVDANSANKPIQDQTIKTIRFVTVEK